MTKLVVCIIIIKMEDIDSLDPDFIRETKPET
jgi:hypothetical protein